MRNLSYENDFDLHEKKSFALRLALKRRNKRTGKCPIVLGLRSIVTILACVFIFAGNPVRRSKELRGDQYKELFCILPARKLEQNQNYN